MKNITEKKKKKKKVVIGIVLQHCRGSMGKPPTVERHTRGGRVEEVHRVGGG